MDNTRELRFGSRELRYDVSARAGALMASRSKGRKETQAPERGVHVGFLGQRSEGIRHTMQYLHEGTARREHCFLIGPNSFVDAVLACAPEIALDRRIELVRTDRENLSPLALLGRIMRFVDSNAMRPSLRLVGCPEWLPPTQMLAWESLLTLIVRRYKFPWLCIHDAEISAESALLPHPFLLQHGKIVRNSRFVEPSEFQKRLRERASGLHSLRS